METLAGSKYPAGSIFQSYDRGEWDILRSSEETGFSVRENET